MTTLLNSLFIGRIKRGLESAAALCSQPGLFSHELHSGPGLIINRILSSYQLDIFPSLWYAAIVNASSTSQPKGTAHSFSFYRVEATSSPAKPSNQILRTVAGIFACSCFLSDPLLLLPKVSLRAKKKRRIAQPLILECNVHAAI